MTDTGSVPISAAKKHSAVSKHSVKNILLSYIHASFFVSKIAML